MADKQSPSGHSGGTADFLAQWKVNSVEQLKSKIKDVDDFQRTPLHCALEFEADVKTITYLLKNGADPNAQDDNGDTPLHYAAQNGNIEVVKLLLKNKADPNIINTFAKTPLAEINAKNAEHPLELYEVLIKAGAVGCFWEPLDMMTEDQKTALIRLGTKHYTRTERDSQNNTLLHWAAHFGMNEEVTSLLAAGAPTKTKNKKGKTAADVAKDAEHHSISSAILNAKKST